MVDALTYLRKDQMAEVAPNFVIGSTFEVINLTPSVGKFPQLR